MTHDCGRGGEGGKSFNHHKMEFVYKTTHVHTPHVWMCVDGASDEEVLHTFTVKGFGSIFVYKTIRVHTHIWKQNIHKTEARKE